MRRERDARRSHGGVSVEPSFERHRPPISVPKYSPFTPPRQRASDDSAVYINAARHLPPPPPSRVSISARRSDTPEGSTVLRGGVYDCLVRRSDDCRARRLKAEVGDVSQNVSARSRPGDEYNKNSLTRAEI